MNYLSCKNPYVTKPFCIIFDKADGYVKKYKTKYLTLFNLKNMRDYLIEEDILKSNVSYVYSHKFMKTKIDPDGHLSLEKTIYMHNLVILFNSVFSENHNQQNQQV